MLTFGSVLFFNSTVLAAQAVDISHLRPKYQKEASVYVIDTAIEKSLKAKSLYGIRLLDQKGLKKFYKQNNYHPLWVQEGSGLNSKGEAVLTELKKAWLHGLNPDQYHVKYLEKMRQPENLSDLPKLEIMMSDAVARFGHDMTGMRVSARAIGQKEKYWRRNLSTFEVLEQFKIVPATRIENVFNSFEPENKLYSQLKTELVRLINEKDTQTAAFSVLPLKLNGILRPGDSHKFVKALRTRLEVKGNTYIYDDDLAMAVMDFQSKRGLKRDGIIGSETIKELNKTNKDRIDQIIANMERLRWIDPEKPDRYIVVNIPSALLWAIEDRQVKFQMPVIVGRKQRQTNSFKVDITGVRFNPTWTVPAGIKYSDYVPKLRKDPLYLSRKGIELKQGYGRNTITLDPSSLNWNTMSRAEMNKIRMVQGPGDHNALGRVRILMPNVYNIYLHDTNTPEYFNNEVRFLSSGCVRLSDPEKVARFVLAKNKNWSDEEMKKYLDRKKMVDIDADKAFPVYILYQTIWMQEDGEMVYAPDIYNRDKKMVTALKQQGDYFVPENLSFDFAVKSVNSALDSFPVNK